MKLIFLLALSIIFRITGFAQDTVTIYLDNNYKKTVKEQAKLIRTVIVKDRHYYMTDIQPDG